MPASAPTTIYTAYDDLMDILSDAGVSLRLDDSSDGSVSAAEQLRIDKALALGTTVVNEYLLKRYAVEDLALSYSVRNYAAVLAACWLCRRRGNGLPLGLAEQENWVMKRLEALSLGQAILDIGTVSDGSPSWTNTRLDHSKKVAQQRKQKATSERSPVNHPVKRDNNDYYPEIE
jgi:hypothetical protein